MNDIPAFVWILVGFIVLTLGVGAYSRMAPTPLPPSGTIWSRVDIVRDDIRYRRLAFGPGASSEKSEPPYNVKIRRLTDQPIGEGNVARYVLEFSPMAKLPVDKPWVHSSVQIGLVDENPGSVVGSVRIVALYRPEASEIR